MRFNQSRKCAKLQKPNEQKNRKEKYLKAIQDILCKRKRGAFEVEKANFNMVAK